MYGMCGILSTFIITFTLTEAIKNIAISLTLPPLNSAAATLVSLSGIPQLAESDIEINLTKSLEGSN